MNLEQPRLRPMTDEEAEKFRAAWAERDAKWEAKQRERMQSARPRQERQLYVKRMLSRGCALLEMCPPARNRGPKSSPTA